MSDVVTITNPRYGYTIWILKKENCVDFTGMPFTGVLQGLFLPESKGHLECNEEFLTPTVLMVLKTMLTGSILDPDESVVSDLMMRSIARFMSGEEDKNLQLSLAYLQMALPDGYGEYIRRNIQEMCVHKASECPIEHKDYDITLTDPDSEDSVTGNAMTIYNLCGFVSMTIRMALRMAPRLDKRNYIGARTIEISASTYG